MPKIGYYVEYFDQEHKISPLNVSVFAPVSGNPIAWDNLLTGERVCSEYLDLYCTRVSKKQAIQVAHSLGLPSLARFLAKARRRRRLVFFPVVLPLAFAFSLVAKKAIKGVM